MEQISLEKRLCMVNNISSLHRIVYSKLNLYKIKSFTKILDGGPTKNGSALLANGSPFTILIIVPDIYYENIYHYDNLDVNFILTPDKPNLAYYLGFEDNDIFFFLYRIITESIFNDNANNLEYLKQINCLNSGFEDITDLILRIDKLQSFS